MWRIVSEGNIQKLLKTCRFQAERVVLQRRLSVCFAARPMALVLAEAPVELKVNFANPLKPVIHE